MTAVRSIDDKEYTHDRLGGDFARHLSAYDTQRRVEVLIDRFLPDEAVRGKKALDVGCGLGYFSARLQQRGAEVTALDLGPSMVEQTRERVGCVAVVGDMLGLVAQFGPDAFDVVVASESIEHTPDPAEAVRQMALVLRPGGRLSLSTPNILWHPVVSLASRLRLRPYDGYENFSTWGGLRRSLDENGIDVMAEYGLHLFPFQTGLFRLSRWVDAHAQWARAGMINLCILGRKRPAA